MLNAGVPLAVYPRELLGGIGFGELARRPTIIFDNFCGTYNQCSAQPNLKIPYQSKFCFARPNRAEEKKKQKTCVLLNTSIS